MSKTFLEVLDSAPQWPTSKYAPKRPPLSQRQFVLVLGYELPVITQKGVP
jgi:hypothetical protein